MKTYKELYAYLLGNQSDALDPLTEGRMIEAIYLLQQGLYTVEEAVISSEQDILANQ